MFKKGQKVRCCKIPANFGSWTLEKKYEVGTDPSYPESISDDKGEAYLSAIPGYRPNASDSFYDCFEPLMEPIMKINFHVLNDSVVLNYGGKTQVVASSDGRYEEVLECIRSGNLAKIPSVVDMEQRYSGGGIELKDGLFAVKGEQLPTELHDRIMKFRDAKLPYDALLKFWENLKKNPSFNSRKMLFKFLEHNGHPLTSDGCFIAYRGVTEDFKDVHTKTFDNKPGSVCQMERSQVDENPNNTCSNGLHVACFDYAKGFGPKLIEVKVNPADVVAVPTDYNGTKMRVCRFEVIQEGSVIKDTVLEEVEEEEEEEVETCDSCGEEECFNYECENEDLDDEEEEEETPAPAKTSKHREINGTGKARQLRHAARGPKGTFVKG